MKKITIIRTIIFFTFAITFALLITPSKVKAIITEKAYDRTYEIADDHLKVTEKKTINITQANWYIPSGSEEVFTIFNPIEGDPLREEKKKLTFDSLRVTDSLGNELKYTLEDTSKGNILIAVQIAKLVRYNEPYTLQLSYNSYGLLAKTGAIRDAYIPAFSEDYIFESDSTKETVSTKIISSKNFGPINFSVPDTQIIEENNAYLLQYSQESLVGDTGWVQMGTKQFYKFSLKQEYNKSSDFPFAFNTYKIIIPRDIQSGYINQNIFFTKFSPEPSKVEKDDDENLIAYFRVPAVDTGIIEIEGYAILNESEDFKLEDSGNLNDIPASIKNRNTQNGKYWEVDTVDIQNLARELKGSETNVYKLVEKTYKYVVDKIDYSDVKRFGINNRQGALKTLQGGAAVCMEYSDLFITLLRAMEIPARGAFGYGYSPLDYESINDGSINHQWAEVYLPKQNVWVPADTTWGESGDLLIGGDLNHFYSHVASVNPEVPSTTEVSFYGSSPQLPERDMLVKSVEESDIKDLQGLSQLDVLDKYRQNQSLQGAIVNITDSIKLFWDRSSNELRSTIVVSSLILLVTIILLIGRKLLLEKSKRKKVN